LYGVTGELGPGIHVVLGTPADGADDLAAVCAGMSRPRSGSVKVFGKEPWSSPGTRARIATLLRDEPADSTSSVLLSLRRMLSLRGDAREATQVLSSLGLAGLAKMPPDRVPLEVRRRLQLGLALGHPNAGVLLLVEPFALPEQDDEAILGELRRHAEHGAVVVVITASVRDAARVGGDVVLLDRGRFVRRPGEPLARELAPGGVCGLDVVSPDARMLASVLALEPAVHSVDWHARSGRVRVRGSDMDALALAIANAARSSASRVTAIIPMLPALDEVRGASAGLWRAAADAARETAAARYKAATTVAPVEPKAPSEPGVTT
jgi:ABC-type multidrug transport system ATPase subunit